MQLFVALFYGNNNTMTLNVQTGHTTVFRDTQASINNKSARQNFKATQYETLRNSQKMTRQHFSQIKDKQKNIIILYVFTLKRRVTFDRYSYCIITLFAVMFVCMDPVVNVVCYCKRIYEDVRGCRFCAPH